MKQRLSFLLAIIVVFCSLSGVTTTVCADYNANLTAHQKIDDILQNYVEPDYHLNNYSFSESEEAELRAVAEEATAGCTTEYDKISAVTRFVAENIYYDYDYYEGRTTTVYTNPYRVWTYKRTICDGYARLMKALLNFIEIPCMYVLADYHAYNVAYDSENDRWIYLDATWCSGNAYSYGEYEEGLYNDTRFDMSLQTLSNLLHHEFIGLQGIIIDGIEYKLYTPELKADWINLDKWYFEVVDFQEGIRVGRVVDSFFDIPTTLIKHNAFSYCESLASITIPDSVTSIGEHAFYDCTNLSSVMIGNNVTSIGGGAFNSCISLTSITIPNSVTNISEWAFGNCTGLTSITIPNSVTKICNGAFDNCTNLKKVTIGNGITSIEKSVFSGCTNLTSITIPNSVISIEGWAFCDCTSLTTITIPDSVTRIGERAFYGCTGLTSVTLPDSVIKIEDGAFYGCTGLVSVSLPVSLNSIGYASFYGTNIKSVFYSGNEAQWNNIEIGGNNYKISSTKVHYNGTSHIESEWIISSTPTCTQNGYKYIECTVCGERFSTETIPATGHNYSTQWTIDRMPSCTQTGSKSHHCLDCDSKKDITVIPVSEHSYFSFWTIDKEATCTEEGSKYHQCMNCRYKADITVIPAKGHNYGEWNIIKESSCIKEGLRSKTCLSCGEVLTETIPVTSHKTGKWITDKKATVNAAGSKHKECTECGQMLETATIAQLKCASPTIKTITNKDYGVRFEWGKVSGADSYKVYRKVSGGSYEYIGKTTKTAYADKTAKSGKKYYYVVKAVNEAGSSEKSASKGITFVDAPTIKTPSSAKSGITVKWSKVSGADGYIVYRKTGSGSYERLAKIKGGTKVSYLDKTAKKGKTYSYKLVAYKGSTKSAGSAVKTIKDKY